MRLFLDECLSPKIAQVLNSEGIHVALHPRDFGELGASDHHILSRCIERDLVLVTANARDFRVLVAAQDIHPGLVILPSVSRERSESLLRDAISFLSKHGDPMNVIVNHVLEVSIEAEMTLSMLPTQEM